MTSRRIRPLVALALVTAVLAGCTAESGGLLDGSPGEGDYTSSDGSTATFSQERRGEPVEFEAEGEDGAPISAERLRGKVVVLNFWYADCPPCRLEAPDLQALHESYVDDGDVIFLGVNVRDTAARARSFTEEFAITYPTILDAADNAVQLAFAGKVAPNAVPTTLVLDRDGRVAARISGLVSDPGLLATLIDDALNETGIALP